MNKRKRKINRKRSLLGRPVWQRNNQFHPVLLDAYDYGLSYYSMKAEKKQMRKTSEYVFKEHRHKHLSNWR